MGQTRIPNISATNAVKESDMSSSPLHALIIGIDEYKFEEIPRLTGAAADADAMDKYLREDLHVPKDQIVNLRNGGATRDAIIGEIVALGKRVGSRKGEAVVIYFAGHGTSTVAPKEWRVGDQSISLIVPYDADSLEEKAEMAIHAIPDRTIGALLHNLAEGGNEGGIGDNITVIFDCCHSGSGTRGATSAQSPDSRRARGFVSKSVLPANIDHDILKDVPQVRQGRGVNVVKGYAQAGVQSHILLAACRETEIAFENCDRKRGYFTHELLRVLRSENPAKITYKDLMVKIATIPGQTPQCEGHDPDRILFNALVPGRAHTVHQVTRIVLGATEQIIVDAGAIHGVTEGTTFSLYANPDFKLGDKPLATMIVAKVYPFETALTYKDSSTTMEKSALEWSFPYLAVQNTLGRTNALRLHVSAKDENQRCIVDALAQVERDLRTSGSMATGIFVESDATEANFGAHVKEGEVTYTIYDSLVRDQVRGPFQLLGTTKTDVNAIQPVLTTAANFFWHLHHAPRKHDLDGIVNVAFHKLKVDEDGGLGPDLKRPYIPHDTKCNLLNSGVVDIVADDDTPYGIVVRNVSEAALHVWAFYFNCSTLSISEYYKPPATGPTAEGSLPGRNTTTRVDGELTIGYGAGGGRPHYFALRPGQNLDVGFIKLFISSQYVDLSGIAQRSPLDPVNAREPRAKESPPVAIWDTVTIAVVQRSQD